MIYSHSRIECFQNCPRKFRYKYIEKIRVEGFDTIERYMGVTTHETLEHIYKMAMNKEPISLEDAIEHYDKTWDDKIGPHVSIPKQNTTHEEYKILGEKCIRDYYKSHAPFENIKTIATELRISTDLKKDGNYRLIGYIDRVDKIDEGIYEIHDYKTSSKMISQKKADTDRQLAIYDMGLREKFKDIKSVEYIWHYLAHNKQIRSKKREKTLEKHKKDIIKSIHRIEEAIVEDWYPRVKTPKCKWCEYQTICPQQEGTTETKQGKLKDFDKEGY
jgi:putative RecB family exonuclease